VSAAGSALTINGISSSRQGHYPPGQGPLAGPGPGQAPFRCRQAEPQWYGDGTEIGTGEGKLYLASVLDMASRRVLGFALGEHHDAQLAYGALTMAVAVRGGQVPGVILHTDQGREPACSAPPASGFPSRSR
jgi:putative transposase